MDQITFSKAEYQTKKRQIRRKIFLALMDKLIPWKQLGKKVALYYPQGPERTASLAAACNALGSLHALVI
jgi:hypothetical protein